MNRRRNDSRWLVCVNAKVRRPRPRSAGARQVAGVFGLEGGLTETLYDNFVVTLGAGEIIAVVGPSGAGKSVLLERIARQAPGADRVDVSVLALSRLPAIEAIWPDDGGPGRPPGLAERMAMLARCGLGEAAAMITPACKLSGGQLHRLAMAGAIMRAQQSRSARRARGGGRANRPAVVVIDEFAGTLDEPTAGAVAQALRRLIDGSDLCLVVATHRLGLLGGLGPDRIVVKPLGEPARLVAGDRRAGKRRADGRRWRIRRGNIAHYRALGQFHYLTGPPAAHKRVHIIPAPRAHRRWGGPEVAAVAVVSPPVLRCRGRNLISAGRYYRPHRRQAIARLNREVECISRVIVHPTYRGLGLASRLVRHILRTSPVAVVESLAVMGRYHPFFEAAGMMPLVDPGFDYVYYSHLAAARAGRKGRSS